MSPGRAADPPTARDGTPVHTARLAISTLRAAHAPLLFPVLADARLYRYIPDSARASIAELMQRFERLERGAPEGTAEVWLNWLLLRLDTGAAIGTLQATVTPGAHAWLGYTLTPSAWGQGFASEACAWLVADLPARYGVHEILASVDVRNAKSIALLERLGFARVGTEAAELRGETTTDYLYRLACPG
jgi:ribosomal-protein-alanine N-acetyltransferase